MRYVIAVLLALAIVPGVGHTADTTYFVAPSDLAAGKPEFSAPHGTGSNPVAYDWDSAKPLAVLGAPTGFGATSYYASVSQSGSTQPDRYRTFRIGIRDLFGGAVSLNQIVGISYCTSKPGAQTDIDWRLTIYTTWDAAGQNMSSWYRDRIQSHPAGALLLNAPANQWNVWQTSAGVNQLLFYTNRPGFTSEDIPWSELITGPVTRGASTWDFATDDVMMIDVTLGANSGGGTGSSQLDGIVISVDRGLGVERAFLDLGASVLRVEPTAASLFVQVSEPVYVDLKQASMLKAASGFQAFLQFDNDYLGYTSGAYTSSPYGWPILSMPVPPLASGLLDVAAGILPPQLPTSADATLANLTFTALMEGETSVAFRSHDPGTRFTDSDGYEISAATEDATIVIDSTPPDITCPGNKTQSNDANLCSAAVDVGVATATDDRSGVASIVGTRTFGGSPDGKPLTDPYLVGVTTITWVATDRSGNTASCVQTVTVNDTQPPTITAPASIIVSTDTGLCTATVADLGTPVTGDNCGVALVTNDHPGTTYPKGVTTVIWTVTDIHGLTATAQQTVTVNDTQKPTLTKGTIASCYPNAAAAEDAALAATTVTDNCPGVITAVTTIGTCRATIVVTATDTSDNSDFVYYVTNIDGTAPSITCPANISVYAEAGTKQASVAVGTATATDGCTTAHFDGFEADNWQTSLASWSNYNSVISQVDSGTDGIDCRSGSGSSYGKITPPVSGNSGVFSRLGGYWSSFGGGFKTSLAVYVDVADPGVIANTYGWDLSVAANNQSNAHRRDFIFHAASDDSAPGKVLIAASNNSDGAKRGDLETIPHYEIAASGWYTFEWNFRDNGSGALAVDMTVKDKDGATVFTATRSDASDLIASVVGGNRYMWFTFVAADKLAIDDTTLTVQPPSVAGVRSDSKPLTDPYPIGTTTITWTATDGCGNTSTCQQTVEVKNLFQAEIAVELEGVVAGPISRCIEFVFGGSGGTAAPQTVSQLVTLTNGSGTATLEVPAGASYTCVTAKDKLHTLRSNTALNISGGKYVASFTGSDILLGGDLTNDNLVDILDFGAFAGLFGRPLAPAECGATGRHADIDGNGDVGTGDFTFIQTHFLLFGEDACGNAMTVQSTGGLSSVSVRDMAKVLGPRAAADADLNKDGVVNQRDVKLFLMKIGGKRG